MRNWIFLAALLTIVCLGCNKEELDTPIESIFLGAVYNLTGDQASLDVPSSKGAQLAIQQANENGGIKGQLIELLLKDGQTDTDVLKTRVEEIMAEAPQTLGFLGLSDTDQVLAAAAAAANNNRVFMTSGATSPLLPGQIPNYLFMACFGDNVQAAAAAEYSYETLGATTVSVVYDSSKTYTTLLQKYFVERFEELGGTVISQIAYTDSNDLDAAIQNTQEADFIFFSALPQDVLAGIKRIRQEGFTVPVVGGDSYDAPDEWENQSQLGEVYFTTHAYLGAGNQRPEVQAFRQTYSEANDGEEPNAFAALGYDAAQLLIQAIEQASTSSPEAILESLSSIQNFEGVTGTISFVQNSRIPSKSVVIMEVMGGSQQYVTEVLPTKIPTP